MRELDTQVDRLLAFYESRRIKNSSLGVTEPSWTLFPFTSLYRWKAGHRSSEDRRKVQEAVRELELTGCFDAGPFGLRFIEDGFKVGTFSWVFMGRGLTTAEIEIIPLKNNVVAIGRTPSASTIDAMLKAGCSLRFTACWIAYSLTVPSEERGVGPCGSFEEMQAYIPIEFS
jgi:hypothetical protein